MTYIGGVRAPARIPELQLRLETRLPATLPVGRSTAVFCYGHCFAARRHVRRLELLLDGVAHRPLAVGMPRRDLLGTVGDGDREARRRAHRSGFWATLVIPAQAKPGELAIDAAVTLAGGERRRLALGRIQIIDEPQPGRWPGPPVGRETIVVCMATHEPDLTLFEAQIESLCAQSDPRWVCLVSDDGTGERRWAQMRALLERDERFVALRAPGPAGPYRNFERALSLAPPEARLFALCDQDDRWYPDKLASLRRALGADAALAFSDLRLVDRRWRVLRESLWEGRRNDHRNLASMLIANSVPGAAMLFTREVVELALPFPDQPGFPFHDHWLALAALAAGRIAYVDRPLYDYVQHAGAVSGELLAARPRSRRGTWRGAYFGGYLPRKLQAQTLLARRGEALPADKRRALRWFAGADSRPLGLLWLAVRPLRRLLGRDETLGGETALVKGILWRWLIARVPACPWVGLWPDASFPDPPRFEQPRLRRWRAASAREQRRRRGPGASPDGREDRRMTGSIRA